MRGNAPCFSVAIFLRAVRDTGAIASAASAKKRQLRSMLSCANSGAHRFPDAPEWVFRDESYELITNMLGNEQNP